VHTNRLHCFTIRTRVQFTECCSSFWKRRHRGIWTPRSSSENYEFSSHQLLQTVRYTDDDWWPAQNRLLPVINSLTGKHTCLKVWWDSVNFVRFLDPETVTQALPTLFLLLLCFFLGFLLSYFQCTKALSFFNRSLWIFSHISMTILCIELPWRIFDLGPNSDTDTDSFIRNRKAKVNTI